MLIGPPRPIRTPRPRRRTGKVTGAHLESQEAYAEFFNAVANLPINQRITDQRYYIAAWFHPRPGDSILDVGAYTGINLRRYAEEGHEIDGVEVGKAYFDVWERRKAEMDEAARNRTRMFCEMFEDFKADRFYDQVLCGEVLEHVVDPSFFVIKMASLLKPGGQVFLSSPREKTRTSARLVGESDLRAWVTEAGLTVEKMFVAVPRKPDDGPRDWGVAQWICIAQKAGEKP